MKTFKDLSKIVGLCFVVVLGLYFTAKQFDNPPNHDYKVIIITGLEGPAEWVPSILKELETYHFDYAVVNISRDKDGGLDVLETLRSIDREVRKSNQKIILLGHSLGTRALLLFLHNYDLGRKVIGNVLIAPPSNEISNSKRYYNIEGYSDFFTYKINVSELNCKNFTVLHSLEDSVVPYEQGLNLSKELGVKIKTFKDRDHLSDKEDMRDIFQEILTARL